MKRQFNFATKNLFTWGKIYTYNLQPSEFSRESIHKLARQDRKAQGKNACELENVELYRKTKKVLLNASY